MLAVAGQGEDSYVVTYDPAGGDSGMRLHRLGSDGTVLQEPLPIDGSAVAPRGLATPHYLSLHVEPAGTLLAVGQFVGDPMLIVERWGPTAEVLLSRSESVGTVSSSRLLPDLGLVVAGPRFIGRLEGEEWTSRELPEAYEDTEDADVDVGVDVVVRWSRGSVTMGGVARSQTRLELFDLHQDGPALNTAEGVGLECRVASSDDGGGLLGCHGSGSDVFLTRFSPQLALDWERKIEGSPSENPEMEPLSLPRASLIAIEWGASAALRHYSVAGDFMSYEGVFNSQNLVRAGPDELLHFDATRVKRFRVSGRL